MIRNPQLNDYEVMSHAILRDVQQDKRMDDLI